MDCARTAARLTSGTVSVIYRRTMAEMPAQREDLQGLLEEGIPIQELLAPKTLILHEGRLSALLCSKMKLGEPDASGRRRPVETGEETQIALDTLIVAIGQQSDIDFINGLPIEINRKGYIQVHPETLETNVPGIFAGGDAIQEGPETIVKALGDGKKIAEAIRRREEPSYTGSVIDFLFPPAESIPVVDIIRRKATRRFRTAVPHLPADKRKNFDEIIHTLTEEEARKEAERCLDCHLMCGICASVCPNRAILTYENRLFTAQLPEIQREGEGFTITGTLPIRVDQSFQIAIQTDFCNECGNCATFCPTAGRPYKDKPRLYLREAEFMAESDNAFRVFHQNGAWSIQGRFNHATHELSLKDVWVYSNPKFTAHIAPETWSIQSIQFSSTCEGKALLSLLPAATMAVLLNGIRESLSYLPMASREATIPPA